MTDGCFGVLENEIIDNHLLWASWHDLIKADVINPFIRLSRAHIFDWEDGSCIVNETSLIILVFDSLANRFLKDSQ
jgi:hypothetical protein